MMKKTMLSGIKPSGQLHLGSYIGALRQFVKYQDDYQMIAFIANLHCITVQQDPEELSEYLRDCAAFYLACGLNPDKSIIFLQSDVMEHAQLGFILGCHTYMGELNRMTQYKDKKDSLGTHISAGFYTYPTLMASDILIYDADYVPVGEDQKQHVELARDIAQRMNQTYGNCFRLPEPKITEVGARIMSLNDPEKKMSKSSTSEKGIIYLKDDARTITKKIMSATTDSLGQVHYDPAQQPGIANLMQIHRALSGVSFAELEAQFAGRGYGTFKKAVAQIVVDTLMPIQERYQEIIASGTIEQVLHAGAQKARPLAQKKLADIQHKVGLDRFKQ